MEKHFICHEQSLGDALVRLNSLSGKTMTLLVVDSGDRLVGTLTDGDLRRAFIAGLTTADNIARAMHRDFSALRPEDCPVEVIADCRSRGIALLPQLDAEGKVSRVIDLNVVKSLLPVSAFLMAGGEGVRLRPLTLTRPKPLLEVGGKAIIDHNIERLLAYGVTNITVCCRYMAEQIEAHVSQTFPDAGIKFVTEAKPLGTIGALALAGDPVEATVLVMNSDLLTDLPFDRMFLHHRRSQAAITVAAIPYTVSVPYAILETRDDAITEIREKPTFSYYANGGIYLLSQDTVKLIVGGQRLDAPELIESVVQAGRKVSYFPFNGLWIDIGTPADYQQARQIVGKQKPGF